MTAPGVVCIDYLPESARRFGEGWAVVAVDVIRATTTAVTIMSTGRRCLPVPTVEAAHAVARTLDRPLLVGEYGGDLPQGFDVQNSPAVMQLRKDLERPAVLLSTNGTRLFFDAAGADAVYAGSLRNVTAQVEHLAFHHPRVAVVGAGTKGEFRREDQLGCARIAAGLLADGYEPQDVQTEEVVARWRTQPVEACADGRSAEYLRRTNQFEDLDFVLSRVDDVDDVYRFDGTELREVER